jgi:DNA-binding transcriptional ArsR family regulator
VARGADTSARAEASASYPLVVSVLADADVSAPARLLAQPARAALVLAIVERGAMPASELAARAGIAPSTTSEHLGLLVDGGFLVAAKRGRQRYYSLADPAVAEAIEALSRIAPQRRVRSLREATKSELIREGRTCYDHLAGRLGVAFARALERHEVVVRRNGTYELGAEAEPRLAAVGVEVDLDAIARGRRPLVRGCLDWSERELHVAGALGAALTTRLFELGWIERRDANRSIAVTDAGREGFRGVGCVV